MVVGDVGRLLVVSVSSARTGGRQQRRSSGSTGGDPNLTDPNRTGEDEPDALDGPTGVKAEAEAADEAVEAEATGDGDAGVSTTSMPSSSHKTSIESAVDDGAGEAVATAAAAAATTAVAHGGVVDRGGVEERDRNPLSPVPGVTIGGGTPKGREGDGASPRR